MNYYVEVSGATVTGTPFLRPSHASYTDPNTNTTTTIGIGGISDADLLTMFDWAPVDAVAAAQVDSGYYEWSAGGTVTAGVASPNTTAILLASAQAIAKETVETNYVAAITALVSGYPKEEIDTFYRQEAEAKAHQSNPAASTPFLDAYVAKHQDLTGADDAAKKATLVGYIMTNVAAFETAAGDLLGQKKNKQYAINNAVDVAAIEGVTLTFIQPTVTIEDKF